MTLAQAIRPRVRSTGTEGPYRPGRPLVEHPAVGFVAPLVVVTTILCAWEVAAQFLNPVLISSPIMAARDFGALLARGALTQAIAISLRELYLGLVIGLVVGIVMGLLMGRYRIVDSALSPFVNAALATPLNILIPLLIIWVGFSSLARVLFVILITVWPVLINTAGGLRNVRRGYIEVGASLGLSERQMLWKIAFPATAPYILAGVRIGVAHSIIGMIVGEMEVSSVGIGFLLNQYGESYQTGNLLALVLMVSLLGVFNVGIVHLIERRWYSWIGATR